MKNISKIAVISAVAMFTSAGVLAAACPVTQVKKHNDSYELGVWVTAGPGYTVKNDDGTDKWWGKSGPSTFVSCHNNSGNTGVRACKDVRNQTVHVYKGPSVQAKPYDDTYISFPLKSIYISADGLTQHGEARSNPLLPKSIDGELIYNTNIDGDVLEVNCPILTLDSSQFPPPMR